MYAKWISIALLWVWAGFVVGCSSKAQEEKTEASSVAPLVAEGWQGAGSMADTRKLHAGVVLPSGKVLVVGGGKGSVSLASVTVYDPGTGSWTVVAPMADGRQSHTATVLPSGKVLVAGGEKSGSGPLASALVYDPAANTWASAGSFATGVARHSLTATRLASGKVLVAGGGNTGGPQNKVDVYDPETGSWSAGPNMGASRRKHTATRLASGKVLVVGGVGSASLATAEVYDPTSNTWVGTGALTTARYDHTATLLPSGKVLVVGGRNSSGGVVGTAEEYDPSTGTWSSVPNVPNALSAREQHTATLLGTGKVLVAGGLNGNTLSSAQVYDPASRQWSATASMGGVRHGHVAVALEAQGKVLVVGGLATVQGVTSGVATAEVYLYDACAAVVCNSAPGACYEGVGTCSNGVCSYAPKASGASCDDGNACTGADACNGAGVCAGNAISCSSPPGQCYQVAGSCSNGSCDYEYKAAGAGCDDGDACTVGEVCNGAGGCAGTPVSCNSPPGQCYEAAGACSNGECSYAPKAAGAACDDGNGGTLNDTCNGAGVCAGAVACTTPPDACHGSPGTYANGVCTYPLKGAGTVCGTGQICTATGQCVSGCWIGGTHYAAGATNPSGACQVCNPSVSTSSWSFKPATTECRASGGVCDVAEYCTGTTATCPADGKQPTTTQCRASGGVCDVAESCTGSSNACPADGYVSSTTQCRASAGVCDVAEYCTGSSPGCPGDGYANNGTSCGSSAGGWGSCGGFSDSCDTTGTQSRTVTASTCGSGTCSASSTSTETQACTRAAPDTTCAAPIYGAWSACSFSDTCAQTGTKTRTVTSSTYNCASGQCVASTSTETQSCTRDTTGIACGSQTGSCSGCSGYSNTCDETGTKTCSVTNYTCSGGTCSVPSSSSQTVACSRNTSGDVCSSSTGCGGCSFSDYCTTQGSKTCTESYTTCASGSCNGGGGSYSYSEACYRPAPNQSCSGSTPAPSYGSWSACGGFSGTCSTTGTQSRSVTVYYPGSFNCSTGTCGPGSSSTTTETQSCTRPQPSCPATSYGSWSGCGGYCSGTSSESRPVTTYSCNGTSCVGSTSYETRTCPVVPNCGGSSYGPWSACSFSSVCAEYGSRSRTVTNSSLSCSTGQCVVSSSTETETCTRSTTGNSCGSPSYGGWSSCGDFGGVCDQYGSQSRSVTTYTCSSGQCGASSSVEAQSCTRNTNGVSCDDALFCTKGDQCWGGSCSGTWENGCYEP